MSQPISENEKRQRQTAVIRKIRDHKNKTGIIPHSRVFGDVYKQQVRRVFGSWSAAVDAALKVDVRRLKPTREFVLDAIRKEFERTGKIPSASSFGPRIKHRHSKLFPSWTVAVRQAIGKDPAFARLETDELLGRLRKFIEEHKRFPTAAEKQKLGKVVLAKRFPSMNDAIEAAVGNSPRLEILRCLAAIASYGPSDLGVSSYEIAEQLPSGYALKQISTQLGFCLRDGLVRRRLIGKASVWYLTQDGNSFLAKRERHGRRL